MLNKPNLNNVHYNKIVTIVSDNTLEELEYKVI